LIMGESISIDANYEVFKILTDEYANNSPQSQGLTQEEYVNAVSDPEVSTTDVVYEGREFAIPQLSTVTANQWLNNEFYHSKFPADYESGSLLHYVDIPNVIPGEKVTARLKELALNEGVLVFDYPTTDKDYPVRIQNLLSSLGINQHEVEPLGTQTYFAGQVTLKKDLVEPISPIASFGEAFQHVISDGEFDEARFQDGASVQMLVGKEDAEHMLTFYERAYEVLNNDPCTQGLDPEEFMAMMTEDETVTKIVRTVDGKITALCLLENDLSKLSWINSDYYQQRYADKYKAGQVVYFPGLAADPTGDVGNNTQEMVSLIAELAYKSNNEFLVVFDCCDKNTGFLDAFLEAMINETPQANIKIESIAAQKYCAIRTSVKQ